MAQSYTLLAVYFVSCSLFFFSLSLPGLFGAPKLFMAPGQKQYKTYYEELKFYVVESVKMTAEVKEREQGRTGRMFLFTFNGF